MAYNRLGGEWLFAAAAPAAARFIADRVELEHVRTRHYAPETNGVVERFNQTLKYEHLYRIEIRDVLELQAACETFRCFYNDTRPHEALNYDRPLLRYLAEPPWPPRLPNLSARQTVQES